MRKPYTLLLSIILFATLTRVSLTPFLDHAPNFSALDALALFCGAYCHQRWHAVAITLLSVWIGDILLTQTLFYEGFYWQYGSYVLMTLLGTLVARLPRTQKTSTDYDSSTSNIKLRWTLLAMPFASASLFFIITNFGVWLSGSLYPKTLDGLITCYIAGIPFFKSTLVSDFIFCGVLFGVAALARQALDPGFRRDNVLR